jgi:hypothetical protein
MRITDDVASATVLAKTETNRFIVDTTTGEMVPITEIKGKFVFPGGFAFVGLVYISKLRNVKLPADGYRLALLLMEEGGYVGIYTKPYKHLAVSLGVSAPRISKLLKQLEDVGVAKRIGGERSGSIMINPAFCFRGSAKEQGRALELWAENHPIGIVARPDTKIA